MSHLDTSAIGETGGDAPFGLDLCQEVREPDRAAEAAVVRSSQVSLGYRPAALGSRRAALSQSSTTGLEWKGGNGERNWKEGLEFYHHLTTQPLAMQSTVLRALITHHDCTPVP